METRPRYSSRHVTGGTTFSLSMALSSEGSSRATSSASRSRTRSKGAPSPDLLGPIVVGRQPEDGRPRSDSNNIQKEGTWQVWRQRGGNMRLRGGKQVFAQTETTDLRWLIVAGKQLVDNIMTQSTLPLSRLRDGTLRLRGGKRIFANPVMDKTTMPDAEATGTHHKVKTTTRYKASRLTSSG